MAYKVKNNGFALLAVAMNASDTMLQVASGKGDVVCPVIASPNHTYLTLENSAGDIEIVKVTARASGSDSMTVVRAQDGTTAKSWIIGDIAECRPCAAAIADLQSEMAAAVAAHEAAADPHPGYVLNAELTAGLAGKENTGVAETLIAAHTSDTSDAHDASAISILDTAGDFTATDVEGALAELQSEKQTAAQVSAAIAAAGTLTGQVAYFAMDTAPTGWLKATGAEVSQTTYAALFAAIGTTFNTGGETPGYFRLPDQRGEILCGFDDGRGVDPGRVFGSWQAGDNAAHTHAVLTYHTGVVPGSSASTQGVRSIMTETADSNMNAPAGWAADASGMVSLGSQGSESRMRNVAMLACIKY